MGMGFGGVENDSDYSPVHDLTEVCVRITGIKTNLAMELRRLELFRDSVSGIIGPQKTKEINASIILLRTQIQRL